MKIQNSGINNQINNVNQSKNKEVDNSNSGLQKKATANQLKDSAKVNLSERAQMSKRIADIARNTPDIDTEKVARLQKLIDEGSYKVKAEAIADRLTDEHLMMPS